MVDPRLHPRAVTWTMRFRFSDVDLPTATSRRAELCLNSWVAFHTVPVITVGEIPKRYRIDVLQTTPLPGRDRSLRVGERAFVPRTAIRLLDQ